MAIPRLLELLAGDRLSLGIEVRLVDPRRERAGLAVRDPARQLVLDLVVDHLREAAQLAPNRLGLAHQHVEHVILCPLR